MTQETITNSLTPVISNYVFTTDNSTEITNDTKYFWDNKLELIIDKDLGIIELPPEVIWAYRTINDYYKKGGELPHYLMNDQAVQALQLLYIENLEKQEYGDLKKKLHRKKAEEEKRKRREAMEEGHRKAAEFKEKQRRWSKGEYTPEELAEKEAKKQAKLEHWKNKRK